MEEPIRRAFDAVRADEDLKRKTLSALARRRRPRTVRRPLAAALAALALVVLTTAGGLAYATPAATVSVDAGTSVELAVNAFGRVVDVRGYDETAQALIEESSLLHQDWTQAAAALSAALDDQGAGEPVTVTVSADNDHCQALLQAGTDTGLACYALSAADAAAAREAGLSLGKYRAYLALSVLDPSVTQEEAGEMTMGELQRCIDACQGQGHGYGQGQGQQGAQSSGQASTGQGTGAGQNGWSGHGEWSGHGGGHHGYGHE